MAFSATTVWEVEQAGSDSNGGGFNSAASGTDRTQQTGAYITFTDLVIDGTTNTKCTSAAHPFDSTSPGNVINITSGAGFTVQRVQIVSVSGATATCDKSLGTLSSTGGNGILGGALASPAIAASVATVAGNITYVKYSASVYVINTTVNIANGIINMTGQTFMVGYDTTRTPNNTDANRPTLQAQSGIAAAASMLTMAANSTITVANLIFDGNSQTTVTGCTISGRNTAINCKALNCLTAGFGTGGNGIRCEATACALGFGAGNYVNCVSHSNTALGFGVAGSQTCTGCLSYFNGGGGYSVGTSAILLACVAYANTGIGFLGANAAMAIGCVAEGNTGVGFSGSAGGLLCFGCASYNNSAVGNAYANTIASSNLTNTTGTFFTDAAAGDFSLNNTANQGATARAASTWVNTFPLGLTAGYRDIGAAQHQDSGGGSSIHGSVG